VTSGVTPLAAMPTLAENAELLRVQLGIKAGLPLHEIISLASVQLGISSDENSSLAQQVDACLAALGNTAASSSNTPNVQVIQGIAIEPMAAPMPIADMMPLPPSGKWQGRFTSRLVGAGDEAQEYRFNANGRMTGRIKNRFIDCPIEGTFNLANGTFTYTEMGGDRATVQGTITGQRIEATFHTHRDSGTQQSIFVAPFEAMELTSTQSAAGCYVGIAPPIPFPILATLSAVDENTMTECCWLFPLPIACPQKWVRDGADTNWFTEQGDQSLQKLLVSGKFHRENKGYCGCKLIG